MTVNSSILFKPSVVEILFWEFVIWTASSELVLIAYASSEGSGEPAHPRSLLEPSLLAHTSSESRGTFRQKARSLAPLIGWACAVKICHDGMLEDTNSLDGAHLLIISLMTILSQMLHRNMKKGFVSTYDIDIVCQWLMFLTKYSFSADQYEHRKFSWSYM